jgi:hypothetical protein
MLLRHVRSSAPECPDNLDRLVSTAPGSGQQTWAVLRAARCAENLA